jgi:TRAP-type C4-dicarboxylate transport system permease small subunit
MNSILRILIKLDNALAKTEATLLIGLVSAMTVIVFSQVVYRYVLAQPLHWSEEMARYLFVWLSILGATLGVQKRGHFGLDILYRMLPDRGKRILAFVVHLLMGTVIFVILFQGITLVQKTIPQESPAMGISMGWAYACLPVGAGLMAVHLLVIFFKDWKNGRVE